LNFSIFKSRAAAVTAGAVALVVVSSAGGAVAATMVTSSDIKDNTIRSVDIHDAGVHADDLSAWTRGRLNLIQPVKSLSGLFTATNPTVTLTPDGVNFGPYANGGCVDTGCGGSVTFSGMNGMTLNDVKNLVYYARYTSTGDSSGIGVPYLRVFLGDGTHDAVFSPNTQSPDPDIAEGPFHEWVATSGSWRYDDDAENGPDESFQQLLTDHGTDTIASIKVTTGFSNGTNLQALLRWMEINGKTYTFGS
jgi:hypothetical protein